MRNHFLSPCHLPELCFSVLLSFACGLHGDDWPAWRGPARDGISKESNWKAPQPGKVREVWRRSVGIGFSSVSVAGGKLYTMGNVKGTDTVWCLDADTGEKIWSHSYPCRLGNYPGPRMTPTVDGDRVFAMSREGLLHCLSTEDGSVRWKTDLAETYGVRQSKWRWGFACSPLVRGNMLLLDLGKVIAIEKATGKTLWTVGNEIAGYSSPIVFTHQGREYVTSFNAFGLELIDLAGRSTRGRFPWKTAYLINAVTPIESKGHIFISSGYGKGCALLKITPGGLTPVYQSKEMRNHVNNCVLYKGYLYGFDGQQGSRGRLVCMTFESGKVMWAQEGMRVGSLMIAGGRIIAMLDRGELLIAEATPEQYREVGRAKLLSGRCWSYPVLSGGKIYCRSNQEGELVCIDVSGR